MIESYNPNKFTYVFDYKKTEVLRASFNELTRKIYGFDFEQWYQNGYWSDNYIPHSLLIGKKIVANISVSEIDFEILGERKRYVQIGTVMTDENYRNNGISKMLMKKVLKQYEDNSDAIYLFANDSVLDFYPKFGFVKADEYKYSKNISIANIEPQAKKLDMSLNENREFVCNKITKAKPISKVAMINNLSLIMFYLISFMSENVYYLQKLDAIVIAEYCNETLSIKDIFCDKPINLDDVINVLTNDKINAVVLGFTPLDISSYKQEILKEENTTLFVKSNMDNIFTDNKLVFPALSHA